MQVPIVEELALDALPKGEISKRWLHLVDDGLSQPISAPVLVARGKKPGRTLVITAAVHGNELNGIPVIHRLFRKLDPTKLAGTVVAVPVVNVPAFHRLTRLTQEGFDLNHAFPGKPDGNAIQVYAHQVLQRIARLGDAVLDLHTASFGRVNSLYVRADLHNEATRRMAYLQRPQIIVHNPPNDQTLRGACDELGVPAITVEIGNPSRFQRRYTERAGVGVRAVLADLGMVPRRRLAPADPPVVCARSYWLYADRGGLLEVLAGITDKVEAGQPIARLVDPFGTTIRTFEAPDDGVIIGHAVNPVATSGARIVHLGVLAPEASPLQERP